MQFGTRSIALVVFGSSMLAVSAFGGCDGGPSGTSSGSGGGTTTDGKYHAATNGQHVSEKTACDALTSEQSKLLLALHCVGTGQTCPDFLRAQFKTACMEYDQGSVDGCIAYYDQQASCDGIKAAFDACVVTPYPGTEPAGCPTGTGGTAGAGGTGGSSTSTGGTGGTGGSSSSTGGTGGTGGSSSSTGGAAGSGGVMTSSSSGT